MLDLLFAIEAAVMAVIADLAVLGVIVLICRVTGTRLPAWVKPAWLRKAINRWIDPNSRRLERLFPIAATV